MAQTSPQPFHLKDGTADDLLEHIAPLGADARLARRIQAAVLQRGSHEVPAALPEVSRRLLERIRQEVFIPRLTLVEKVVSPSDGAHSMAFPVAE